LDWLATQDEAMRDMLVHWARINSGSYHAAGLQKMSAVLNEEFAVLGAKATQHTLPAIRNIAPDGQATEFQTVPLLRFQKRPQAPRQVLLVGHMDTVYGAEHPFQDVDFLDDNTLNGPGVADMKGGLLIMLFALQAEY